MTGFSFISVCVFFVVCFNSESSFSAGASGSNVHILTEPLGKSSSLQYVEELLFKDQPDANVTRIKKQGIYIPDHREPLEMRDLSFNGQEQKPPLSQVERMSRYRFLDRYDGRNYRIGPRSFNLDMPGSNTPRYPGMPGIPGVGGNLPYVLTEARLKEIRLDFLYWFFDQGGDDGNGDYQKDIHDSTPKIHKNFNFQVPFFGFRLNYTRLSMHGYLEFSDPPEHYTYPLSFPNQDWPKKNDPAFIGIFFSKCRIGSIRDSDADQRRPGVYFRLERDLMTRSDQFGIEMRERVKWDIRDGVVGADTFIPKHAVIVTWKNMSFAGGIDNSLFKTNTFQLVLATDEVFTYAIFNYVDIQWTSHTEAGGDTTGGEGGVPAFVGFNAGNGTRSFEYKPYSQASTLRDLTGRGFANGFPGRHIFRIDENILLGTCNKDIAGTRLKLTFAPESGNMLGGTVVNITGPCFEPGMKVRCKFDIENVVGKVVNSNRAICIQPFLMAEGYVIFEVAIGDGAYNWKGKYFVETPATATQKIFFDTKAVHEKYPEEIKITWDKRNLTENLSSRVQISLWGYKETTIRPELMYIDMLEEGWQNTGAYPIAPKSYAQRDNYMTNDLRVGFIQINLTNPESYQGLQISPVMWSRPIPLGWYFAPQWERQYGANWADAMCDEWTMNDRYLKNFAADIPQCPCTLEQALADKGRFMPDYSCDRDSNPDCFYHKGAVHCVRTGSPSMEGSEQQCCYDKNFYLMMSYDQQWGSRPRRSHNLGYIPWNEANKVPTLSQWFHDLSPFYFCCLWQEEQAVGCETFRFERRPTQDCVAYQGPGVATVFGDPHFITFDGFEYTFNGKGEFVLVHADTEKFKFDVQGRFEQLQNNIYGEVRATQLTSVVARDNTSAVVEVRMRPLYAQWRYRLDVFVDGRRVFFDRPALRVQHFPGVTVYTPLYVLDQHEVIIMFQSGAGVEVIENKGFMTTRIYLPWQYINQTRGLLGNWNFDLVDELTLPDTSIVNIQTSAKTLNNFQRIHQDFGIKWMLEDREDRTKGSSLFVREYGRTASYYANITFEPEWRATPQEIIPANRTKDLQMAKALCGDSYQCKYDYAVSLNREMAFYTLTYQAAFSAIRKKNTERVVTCGVLETPRFGRKSNFLFVPGTKVTFECNQGFILIGDARRTCTPEGIWNTPEYGYTECLREEEFDMRAIGSTTVLVGMILLPLIVVLVCVAAYVVRKYRKGESIDSWNYMTNSRRASLARRDSAVVSPLRVAENSERQMMSGFSSPTTSSSASDKRAPLTYDGVYLTHEPVPGKPSVEFEPKIWDITEDDVFSAQNSKVPSPALGGAQALGSKTNINNNVTSSNTRLSSPTMPPPPVPPHSSYLASQNISEPPSPSASSIYQNTRLGGGFGGSQPQIGLAQQRPVRSQSIETDIF